MEQKPIKQKTQKEVVEAMLNFMERGGKIHVQSKKDGMTVLIMGDDQWSSYEAIRDHSL